MGVWLKIGIFVSFLIVFFILMTISRKSMSNMLRNAAMGKSLLSQQIMVLTYLTAYFGFIWMLSGFFDIRLVLIVLIAMEIAPLLTGIFWALLGRPKTPWQQQLTWEGAQIGARHPFLLIAFMGTGLILLVGFPISAGITYFGNTIPSTEGTLAVFRVVLFWFIILGFIIGFSMNTLILASESLHEDTRSHAMVDSLSRFIITGLWLSIGLWAFEIAGEGKVISVGELSLTVSPIVIAALFVFYLIAVIGPYFSGVQRAKRLNAEIHETELGWLHRIVEIMQFPTKLEDRISSLHELVEQIDTNLSEFVEKRPGLRLGKAVENGEVFNSGKPDELALVKAYNDSHDFDPRTDFLKASDKCQTELQNVIKNLQDANDEVELKALVESYEHTYDERFKKLKEKATTVQSAKPMLLYASAAIIGPIATPVLSQFGKWIIDTFTAGVS